MKLQQFSVSVIILPMGLPPPSPLCPPFVCVFNACDMSPHINEVWMSFTHIKWKRKVKLSFQIIKSVILHSVIMFKATTILLTLLLSQLPKNSHQNELSDEMDRILRKIESQAKVAESKLISELKVNNFINVGYAVTSILGIIFGVSSWLQCLPDLTNQRIIR